MKNIIVGFLFFLLIAAISAVAYTNNAYSQQSPHQGGGIFGSDQQPLEVQQPLEDQQPLEGLEDKILNSQAKSVVQAPIEEQEPPFILPFDSGQAINDT